QGGARQGQRHLHGHVINANQYTDPDAEPYLNTDSNANTDIYPNRDTNGYTHTHSEHHVEPFFRTRWHTGYGGWLRLPARPGLRHQMGWHWPPGCIG
ncbi:MAG: hypothetical protein ACE5MB_07260, partial [Anaerolineae bacterium]